MFWKRLALALLAGLFALVIIIPLAAWGTLALWFRLPGPEGARALVAGLFAALAAVTIVSLIARRGWRGLAAFAIAFAAIVVWWGTITPPQVEDWTPEVARQTTGRVEGDILTLSDVRDFDWRTNDDFTPHWSERSYDLSKLKTVDLFLAYWAGPAIAHLMMSFGFDGGQALTWSIEIRQVRGSEYSPLADAFRTHTLVSLATTERDSVRLRANVRHEDVRLYRLRASPEQVRTLLLGYVTEANSLKQSPAFYNTITTNCMTAVVRMIRGLGGNLPLDWRLLVNGFLPSYLYEHNFVVTSIPLEDLIERADIRERARKADQSPDFSAIIREGVPSPNEAAAQ